MAGRKRREWNKYIADYDKLRMFLRYISYGCYHKQYLARQLGQSARSYEDNWARVWFFLPEDRLQAVRQGHRDIHSLKGDSYHSAFNDLVRTYAIKSLKSSAAFALLCLLQVFSSKAADTRQTFFDAFTRIQQEKAPYFNLLLSPANHSHFTEKLARDVMPVFMERFHIAKEHHFADYLVNIYFSTVISAISLWIQHDRTLPLSDLSELLGNVLTKGIMEEIGNCKE